MTEPPLWPTLLYSRCIPQSPSSIHLGMLVFLDVSLLRACVHSHNSFEFIWYTILEPSVYYTILIQLEVSRPEWRSTEINVALINKKVYERNHTNLRHLSQIGIDSTHGRIFVSNSNRADTTFITLENSMTFPTI